ncbi:pyridoxal phosphate-dependent aminotransferase family protein [Pedobacter changchengzhani]|uniref:Pyridoxal phosphate-dependent aminotransferase family protein n=1 Tax=Pedobacter changchengzhani TaxID=2529274 RepID=A0A4R5MIM7_9SPHI|nr:pyridoxal phosphate-dependent aminotransferase family protein [Pedobacter changchengzhani]TDG34995.1 pyridoxal phosphate-dependent aminotransferase family protein [Pedobacter changchengzhani]
MKKIEQYLGAQLQSREDNLSIRKLSTTNLPIDFCSNDYLGFARSSILKSKVEHYLKSISYANGSGGSRLLSGNTSLVEETEQDIANFHKATCGLIFNSGYDANIGLFSCIAQRGDTIITDSFIHASIIDGCRLSHATRYKFEHNNLDDLEAKLKIAKGNIIVAVESVYSMDGDCAPLAEIAILCTKYQANLIVDEAHATGIFGALGRGLVNQLNLEDSVFARIITFGKALGTHGAIILGSETLRNYLINFARSFIYTTAAPIHNIVAIKCAYQLLQESNQQEIQAKINLFRSLADEYKILTLDSNSCIQGVLYASNKDAKKAAQMLQLQGLDVRAILSPTVAVGKERIRICLHTFNKHSEIKSLIENLKKI